MRHNKHLCLLVVLGLITTGCNGIFSDIYDAPVADASVSEGFSITNTLPNRYRLRLDTSDFGMWTYVSLKNKTLEKLAIPFACEGEWNGVSGIAYRYVKNGEPPLVMEFLPTDSQPESSEWDIALHRFDVRSNAGTVAISNFRNLDEIPEGYDTSELQFLPDCVSDSTVMVDIHDMLTYRIGFQNIQCNPVLSGWVKMHINAGPPSYTATGAVYFLKLEDGSQAAMQLLDYMNEQGAKGHLDIDIIYPLQ